jgi:hypothetical protein
MFTSKTALFSCIVTLVTLASCTDLGDQPFDGLAIQTSAARYRTSDTLRVTVTNKGGSACLVASCNATLTYYIEILDQGTWKDRDSINIGPCLALYGPIVLTPGATCSATLPLARRLPNPTGKCRIRSEYQGPGQNVWQRFYSKVFELTE